VQSANRRPGHKHALTHAWSDHLQLLNLASICPAGETASAGIAGGETGAPHALVHGEESKVPAATGVLFS
jgi:hypothetical protein